MFHTTDNFRGLNIEQRHALRTSGFLLINAVAYAAIGVARDAFGQTSSVIASLRPRGKVVIRTGVSAPHDLP